MYSTGPIPELYPRLHKAADGLGITLMQGPVPNSVWCIVGGHPVVALLLSAPSEEEHINDFQPGPLFGKADNVKKMVDRLKTEMKLVDL